MRGFEFHFKDTGQDVDLQTHLSGGRSVPLVVLYASSPSAPPNNPEKVARTTPDCVHVYLQVDPMHNPWGFIDSKYSYEGSGDVTRTASYCGMESELELSTCNVVKHCFEDNDNVNAWSTCMENGVSALLLPPRSSCLISSFS